jgi:hypothetical protein
MASYQAVSTQLYIKLYHFFAWSCVRSFKLQLVVARVFVPRILRYTHGRRSRGDESPRISCGKTLIQVVPPDFCRFSKFQALAMDSSPQIYATGYIRFRTPIISSTGYIGCPVT